MDERICFRRFFASSLVRCGLKLSLYSFPSRSFSAFCCFSRSSNELRKNCAVRRTAVRSPCGTSTPIVTSASRHRFASRSYTA